MQVFIVTRNGVWVEQLAGVFSTQDSAVNAALSFKQKESDDHHSYAVQEVTLDERFPFDEQGAKERDNSPFSASRRVVHTVK